MAQSPALDHIVILLPHRELQTLPSWLTEAFVVANGGQHVGGVTENKLIVFQDGTYIELIAFVGGGSDGDGSKRRSHRWGAQPEGHVIDWALGLPKQATDEATDAAFASIQARVRAAGAGLGYRDLMPGGRKTPDGVVLRWATSSPGVLDDNDDNNGTEITGGKLPFWCLDRTGRKLRVPYAADGGRLARHPSAAVGVEGITIHVADAALLDRLRRVYSAILAKKSQDEWELATPEKAWHGQAPHLRLALLSGEREEKTRSHGAEKGWIELSLFSTAESRTVGGQFVDGWQIEIRLVKVD